MIDTTMTLADGRVLAYTELGLATGPLVFYFHGAPSSRLDLAAFDADFQLRDVRVVCPDRPGYGGSSPRSRRQLHDWPNDVVALADHLGRERFAVVGISSGGPYAVACAALLPERVAAGAVVAGVTDVAWPGFFHDYGEWLPGLAELMRCDEVTAKAWCDERYGADGSRFGEHVPRFGPDDRDFLRTPELADAFRRSMREAMRQGMGGFAQDITIENRPWSFNCGAIVAPMRILHGETDSLVPVGHSQHTAELIPNAVLELVPSHGHLSIFTEFPRVAADLATSLR